MNSLLTLADWNSFPEGSPRHAELVAGVIHTYPSPGVRHQWAMNRLGTWLDQRLPHEVAVFPAVEVLVDPASPVTVRAPDLVVVRALPVDEYPVRFEAADVLLAVEIVSPGTAHTDRAVKPIEYAEAGIPHYWLLEIDEPITLTAFTLVDGEYKQVASGTGKVEILSPFPVTLDLDALLTR